MITLFNVGLSAGKHVVDSHLAVVQAHLRVHLVRGTSVAFVPVALRLCPVPRAPLEALYFQAVLTVGHVLHYLFCLPVAPPAFHYLLARVYTEVVQGSLPSAHAVEASVHQQVGHILASGNDGVFSLVNQYRQLFHDFRNLCVVEGMALHLLLQLVFLNIVGQLEHGVRFAGNERRPRFLDKFCQFRVGLFVLDGRFVVGQEAGKVSLLCFCVVAAQQFVGLTDVGFELIDVSTVDDGLFNESLTIGYNRVQPLRHGFVAKIVQFEVVDDALAHIGSLEHDAHLGLAAAGLEGHLGQSAPPASIGKGFAEEFVAHFGIDISPVCRIQMP